MSLSISSLSTPSSFARSSSRPMVALATPGRRPRPAARKQASRRRVVARPPARLSLSSGHDLEDLKSAALAAVASLSAAGLDPSVTDDQYDALMFDVVAPAIKAYAHAAGHPTDRPPFVVGGRTMFLWLEGARVVSVPLTVEMVG